MKKMSQLIVVISSVLLFAGPGMRVQAAETSPLTPSNHAIVDQAGTFDAASYVERLGLINSPQRPQTSVTCVPSSDGTAVAVNTVYSLSPEGYIRSRSSDPAAAAEFPDETAAYDTIGNVVKRSVGSGEDSYEQQIRYSYNEEEEIDCQYISAGEDESSIYYKYDYYGRIVSFNEIRDEETYFTRLTYKDNHLQNVSALNGLRYISFTADDAGRIIGYQASYGDLAYSETADYTYNETGCLLTGVVTRTDGSTTTTYITSYIY